MRDSSGKMQVMFWYQRERISGADARTFRHLDQAFYRDKNRIYWSMTPLDGADPDTFRTLVTTVHMERIVTTFGRETQSFRIRCRNIPANSPVCQQR